MGQMVNRLNDLESFMLQFQSATADAKKTALEETQTKTAEAKNRVEASVASKKVKPIKRRGRYITQPDVIEEIRAEKEWRKKLREENESDSDYEGTVKKRKKTTTKVTIQKNGRKANSPFKSLKEAVLSETEDDETESVAVSKTSFSVEKDMLSVEMNTDTEVGVSVSKSSVVSVETDTEVGVEEEKKNRRKRCV